MKPVLFVCVVYGRLEHVAVPQPETPAAVSQSVGCGAPDGHHHLRTGTARRLISCFQAQNHWRLIVFFFYILSKQAA